MLVTPDSRNGGGSSMAKAQLVHRTGATSARVQPTIPEESVDSTDDNHDEYLGSCYTEDDEEEDYEEYDDFSQLPDTRSITSDDSFYPPEDLDDFEDLERSPSVESEVALLSFFQACCSNQALTVKFMIRRGVTEDEVKETDKNNKCKTAEAHTKQLSKQKIGSCTRPVVFTDFDEGQG
ncbi:hypothetical protein AOLI_G00260010 [Acnodon oligacanthus]